MPTKHEGRVSAERQGSQERFVTWCEPQLGKEDLPNFCESQRNLLGVRGLTIWKVIVITKVWIGLMLGRTAKTVSPTRPLDAEATPETFTGVSHPACLMSV